MNKDRTYILIGNKTKDYEAYEKYFPDRKVIRAISLNSLIGIGDVELSIVYVGTWYKRKDIEKVHEIIAGLLVSS